MAPAVDFVVDLDVVAVVAGGVVVVVLVATGFCVVLFCADVVVFVFCFVVPLL